MKHNGKSNSWKNKFRNKSLEFFFCFFFWNTGGAIVCLKFFFIFIYLFFLFIFLIHSIFKFRYYYIWLQSRWPFQLSRFFAKFYSLLKSLFLYLALTLFSRRDCSFIYFIFSFFFLFFFFFFTIGISCNNGILNKFFDRKLARNI